MAEPLILPDAEIYTHWKCPECSDVADVPVTFFQDNGTPVCADCDRDMVYVRVYWQRIHDGASCPACKSTDIEGTGYTAFLLDEIIGTCVCRSCSARWDEHAKIVSFEDLTADTP
jgi:hypothetical protein